VLQQANGQKPVYGEDASDLIAATTAVTVTYRPRWLWPRP